MKIKCLCRGCGKEFYDWPSQIALGSGKFCSRECGYESRRLSIKKVCAACGKEFAVAAKRTSRYAAPHEQRLCSNDCQQAARYRRGRESRDLSIAEAAYLAGIMDGEGSVMIVSRGGGRSLSALLSVTNTKYPMLQWIIDRTMVGLINRQYQETSKRSETWFWRCWGDGALMVLRQIKPYLVIKGEQASLAIDFQERLRIPALKADRTWQQDYRLNMKAMNRRGPT